MMLTVTGVPLVRRGYIMEHFDINFVRSDGKSVNVRLFSHYTCICGKFSGEGKSEFVSLLEDGISTGDISVVSKLPFAIATLAR